MIRVIDSMEGFDALRGEWEALAAGAHVCHSFAWCRAAWECVQGRVRGNRLRLLQWRGSAGGAALFPFFVDGHGTLRLIGDDFSDSGDALAAGEGDSFNAAFREAAEAVKGMDDVSRVCFVKLPASSRLLAFWLQLLPHAIAFKAPGAPYLHVVHSDDVVRAMPGWRQREHNHLDALARKSEGLEFAVSGAGDAFPRREIENLREAMVADGRRGADFLPPPLLDFAARLHESGMCEMPTFRRDGRLEALAFRFSAGGESPTVLSWVCLARDGRLVSALYLRYLQWKARDGAFTLDFGVGTYGYKMSAFRPEVAANFTLRASKTRWGRLCDRARMLVRSVRI